MDIVHETIKIMTTKDLNGLTGDNGETIVVFIRNINNPLSSGWRWFFDMDEALKFADNYRNS